MAASWTRTSKRSALRLALAALVAALCSRALSVAFSAVLTGAPALDRPMAAERRKAAASASDGAEEGSEAGTNMAEKHRAMTENEAKGQPVAQRKPVRFDPPMATCFVQAEVEGKSVLEEWLLRGESENVDAFHGWREESLKYDTDDVRCTQASHQEYDQVMCLECLSRNVSPSKSVPGVAVAAVQAQIISTFVSVQQCLASTEGGKGFCKTGQVSVAL